MKVFKSSFTRLVLSIFVLFYNNISTAQGLNSLSKKTSSDNNIVMTWNKDTPESEMKDDIRALADKGITIKYSDVKRNSNNEITAIKVDYSDRKGNKGKLELENQKPISTIKFFSINEKIGFGEPQGNNIFLPQNNLINGFPNADNLMRQFNLGNGSQSFSFSFPENDDGTKKLKSQIKIQEDGKKPLVIEDGVIIEGGEDYSKEEVERIKNKYQFQFSEGTGANKEFFDFRNQDGLENFKNKMEKMKTDAIPNFNQSESDFEKAKQEMLNAKEEMLKAKEELEKVRKDIEKANSNLKTRKVKKIKGYIE